METHAIIIEIMSYTPILGNTSLIVSADSDRLLVDCIPPSKQCAYDCTIIEIIVKPPTAHCRLSPMTAL